MFTVILLDDEKPQREGIARFVSWGKLGFSAPVICQNGWEALEKIREHPSDVLVTDVRMPGMDEIEVMRKAHEISPGMYIIVISGFAEFEYAQDAMRNGAREYILKPVKPEDIEKALSRFVREKNQEINEVPAGSDLIADIEKILSENVTTGIGILEIAKRLHVNQSHMCTAYKKSRGETIASKLNRLQIEKACMYLCTTRMSISEIAEITGDRNPNNFTQWFRKQMGMTPGEYRKNNKKGE